MPRKKKTDEAHNEVAAITAQLSEAPEPAKEETHNEVAAITAQLSEAKAEVERLKKELNAEKFKVGDYRAALTIFTEACTTYMSSLPSPVQYALFKAKDQLKTVGKA